MRFRIVEFSEPQVKGSKDRFFVELGTEVKEKRKWWFPETKIIWESVKDEDNENNIIGHKNYGDAVKFISDFREQFFMLRVLDDNGKPAFNTDADGNKKTPAFKQYEFTNVPHILLKIRCAKFI